MKKAILRLEQGGKILEAGTEFEDFKVFGLEGLSGLEFDFNLSNNPCSPNAVINNKRPIPREISMIIHATGDKRQFLNGFFNPYETGRLTVTWDGAQRWIEYAAHPCRIVQDTVYRRVEAYVTLICPEPFWKDMDDYGKNIASRMKLLAFPFVMRERIGVVADYRLFNTEVKIFNRGDVQTGAVVVFKSLGDVKNPCLTLNNGAFLRGICDMKKGDVLEFNTNIDDLGVRLNDSDILHLTDPKMSFFQIPKGESIIKYSADEGTANLQVYIYYTPQYISI